MCCCFRLCASAESREERAQNNMEESPSAEQTHWVRDKNFVARLQEAKNHLANPDVATKIEADRERQSKKRQTDEKRYRDYLEAQYERVWPKHCKAAMEFERNGRGK